MVRLALTLSAAFVVAVLSLPAVAGPQECQDAIESYNSATEDVSTALRGYSNCVSNSEGKDDCSVEFGSLRSAQDDFESAVSIYGADCG